MSIPVTVYSTPTCPYCIRAKQYLKDHGVEFVDIDVAANPEKGKEMVEKSGQMGVPVLAIGDEIIVGFNKEKINAALSL